MSNAYLHGWTHRIRQLGAVFFGAVAGGWLGRGVVWVLGLDGPARTIVLISGLGLGLAVGIASARDLEPYTDRERRDTRSGLISGALIIATIVVAYTLSRLVA